MKKGFLFVIFLLSCFSNSYSMQKSIIPLLQSFVKNHPYSVGSAITAALLVGAPLYYYRNHLYEERWNWSEIATENIEFPQGFLWGDSISAFQYEGTQTNDNDCQNSWTEWEDEKVSEKTDLTSFSGILKALGIMKTKKYPRTPSEKRAGHACEGWSHYKKDAKLLKKAGMNTHRLSLEWAKIEPVKGEFNEEALQHYIDVARTYVNKRFTLIINFWHHTLPIWIYNNNHKVGFEDPETKERFVNYALHVLNEFKKASLLQDVKLWLTFNEPIGYALAAHVDGKLPPGEKFHFKKAGIVAKNMLDAHIEISDRCKKEIDDSIKFSIAHVMTPVQPYNPHNPLHQWIATIFDNLINDVALEYFKTGKFNWLNLVYDNNPNAIGKLDFLGVNYYTHTLLSLTGPVVRKNEVCADGYENSKRNRSKALYAEGLYQTLKKAAKLGVPILITENGCAAQGDSIELRTEYFKKHLYVIRKAMQAGIDIRGYLVWTGIDCFGWDAGQHSNHGIYKVDFDTQERTLKPNAHYLVDVMQNKISKTDTIEPLWLVKK